ncbi:hypothetical protein RU639_007744 [Aspergillus parasiticus]
MTKINPYRGILVELKDIIFTSSSDRINLPINTFKSILCCGATAQYQCGKINRAQYYSRLAKDFALSLADVTALFDTVQATICPEESFLAFLAELKSRFGDQLKLYAVANMSREDYAMLKSLPIDWSLFDGVFISADLGMRKPELRFFRHILKSISMKPEDTILVDNDTDNILCALSMGLKGILFGSTSVPQALTNLLEYDHISRAEQFLRSHAKSLHSVTHTGVTIRENFAQLLILEATGDIDLVELEYHPTTWNYFIGTPVLTQTEFPHDLDTTSLATTVLDRPKDIANGIMDEMLKYRSDDDLMLTFFTDFKNRVDPVVCCNVLSLFYKYGRGHELHRTLAWVRQVLIRRAYINGTAFYPMPEAFLYFFFRFLQHITHLPQLYDGLKVLLKERLQERVGVPVDPISLSMRLIACNGVGIHDPMGLNALLSMQNPDGSWDLGTMYHYASKRLPIGNQGVSTAMAIKAIKQCQASQCAGI